MDQITQPAVETDADHAFEQLRGEVSLLRRAIEGLAAERQGVPDYAPTLTTITDRMTQFADWARRVAETPLLTMTPEKLEHEIARVAITARQSDRDMIERANTNMIAAIAAVRGVTESARSASEQWRALCLTGGTCVLAGMALVLALFSIL